MKVGGQSTGNALASALARNSTAYSSSSLSSVLQRCGARGPGPDSVSFAKVSERVSTNVKHLLTSWSAERANNKARGASLSSQGG